MDADRLLILGNLIVCLLGAWLCVCRMSMMDSRTKRPIRAQYTTWFCLFAASAISWTYDEPATLTQLLMGCAVVGHLLLGIGAWRYGAPTYTVLRQWDTGSE